MSTKPNSKKLSRLNLILYIAIFLFVITLGFYFLNFHGGFSLEKNDWGTFGDFMGGTLNPLFALFSLFAIIYTIKIQTEELELSREELKDTKEELKASRIAQEEQSESFKIQNASIRQQTFENNFFQLMDLFNNTRNNLTINIFRNSFNELFINNINEGYDRDRIFMNGSFSAYIAIKNYLLILEKNYTLDYDAFNKIYEGNTGTYFIQNYQILKFIANSQIKDKQLYVNILRAQFTKEELEFLFYHCLGSIGSKKFKPLIEEFEFFEHITLNDDIEKKLTQYDRKAFGEKENILEKYDELKNKS
ncbi:putative phage abortive infection protein [Sulfurospirillum arcachonense]|uniref:putative phage abortive infection protein n=1 Tax=Sulfurospirillum arcachonense TaxID=57666 RepID=UPI0004695826|nr:putative phage abortive infection protein [Sulfurospirillum arcachonense]